jgi:hypothetical protein
MRIPVPERRVGIKDSQAELDRFENQAAAILAFVLTLAGVIYAILMEVLL